MDVNIPFLGDIHVLVSTVAAHQEGLGFEATLGPFRIEFAYSVNGLCGFSRGSLVPCYSLKTHTLINCRL